MIPISVYVAVRGGTNTRAQKKDNTFYIKIKWMLTAKNIERQVNLFYCCAKPRIYYYWILFLVLFFISVFGVFCWFVSWTQFFTIWIFIEWKTSNICQIRRKKHIENANWISHIWTGEKSEAKWIVWFWQSLFLLTFFLVFEHFSTFPFFGLFFGVPFFGIFSFFFLSVSFR